MDHSNLKGAEALPVEVWVNIGTHLSFHDLLSLRACSKVLEETMAVTINTVHPNFLQRLLKRNSRLARDADSGKGKGRGKQKTDIRLCHMLLTMCYDDICARDVAMENSQLGTNDWLELMHEMRTDMNRLSLRGSTSVPPISEWKEAAFPWLNTLTELNIQRVRWKFNDKELDLATLTPNLVAFHTSSPLRKKDTLPASLLIYDCSFPSKAILKRNERTKRNTKGGRNNNGAEPAPPHLAMLAKQCPNLHTLSMRNYGRGLAHLLVPDVEDPSSTKLDHLEVLDLRGTRIPPLRYQWALAWLKHPCMRSLKRLLLGAAFPLDVHDVYNALCDAYAFNPALSALNLNQSARSPASFDPTPLFAVKGEALDELQLLHVDISNDTAQLVASHCSRLRTLTLSRTHSRRLGASGISAFATNCTGLTHLTLHRFDNDIGAAIALAVEKCPLVSLDIRYCRRLGTLHTDFAFLTPDTCASSKTLRELDLGKTDVKESMGVHIASLFPKLRKVNLDYVNTRHGELVRHVLTLPSLTCLSLQGLGTLWGEHLVCKNQPLLPATLALEELHMQDHTDLHLGYADLHLGTLLPHVLIRSPHLQTISLTMSFAYAYPFTRLGQVHTPLYEVQVAILMDYLNDTRILDADIDITDGDEMLSFRNLVKGEVLPNLPNARGVALTLSYDHDTDARIDNELIAAFREHCVVQEEKPRVRKRDYVRARAGMVRQLNFDSVGDAAIQCFAWLLVLFLNMGVLWVLTGSDFRAPFAWFGFDTSSASQATESLVTEGADVGVTLE